MQNKNENDNLSDIGIYNILGVKNPKQFHLKESIRNILKSIELLEIAKRDLLSTPISTHKRSNKAIVNEIAKNIDNVCWNLLPLCEAIQKLQTIKQDAGPITDKALQQLLDELQSPEDII